MKSMLDVLLGIVGLAALVFAIYEFYVFASAEGSEGPRANLYMAIAGAVVLAVCALALFLRHSGAEEEIHITQ
ncbi:MAG TPA: hypothetical protein VFS10_20365 [Pyrinomonadaceae bacterium]|nr:hypothetical protein [Pyrinomonadaceae bacterium]